MNDQIELTPERGWACVDTNGKMASRLIHHYTKDDAVMDLVFMRDQRGIDGRIARVELREVGAVAPVRWIRAAWDRHQIYLEVCGKLVGHIHKNHLGQWLPCRPFMGIPKVVPYVKLSAAKSALLASLAGAKKKGKRK